MEGINGMDQRIITAQTGRTVGIEQKKVNEAERVNQVEQAAEQEAPKRVPQKDMYIKDSGKDNTPIGLYRVEADENGSKTVKFDDPAMPAKASAEQGSDEASPNTEEAGNTKQEAPKMTTHKDMAPIQRMKAQRDKLKMQIRQEDDPQKAEALKKKLKALEKKIKQAAK